MCHEPRGFHARLGPTTRLLLAGILHLSWAKCHGGSSDFWGVDKQDKQSLSASLHASLPSLYQRRRHLLPCQGCSVLLCLPPKEQIVGWFHGYLHTSFFSCRLSLSLSRCPWQTLQFYARTADSSRGWVSALATVGTHGNMRGAVEGGMDRGVIWPQPKAPVLVSWHWERCFRWRHMMVTQQLASCVTVSLCHLQNTKIKSCCNTKACSWCLVNWYINYCIDIYIHSI